MKRLPKRSALRVIIVSSSNGVGGGQTVARNLADGLARQGYGVSVVFLFAADEHVDHSGAFPAIELGVLNCGNKLRRFCVATWRLGGVLRGRKPHVVICSPGYPGVIALALKYFRITAARIVTIVDYNVFAPPAPKWHERAVSIMARLLLPTADQIITSYSTIADHFKAHEELKSRTTVIYNPTLKARPEYAKARRRNSEATKGILAIGRLGPEKDLCRLVEALATVRQSIDARLTLVGDGPERARIEATARRVGLCRYVRITGYVSDPIPLLEAADVVVNCSYREGLPNGLVEAMAMGVPVVATDTPSGGSRELLDSGKYGILIPLRDTIALGDAIKTAATACIDTTAAREHVLSNFSLDISVDRYAKVLESI